MSKPNNRKLLELAARVGKYDHFEYVENDYRDGRKVTGHYDSLLEVCINPLTDVGDALRLSVNLSLSIVQDKVLGVCAVYLGNALCSEVDYKDGPIAATCRAIVCAAARLAVLQATYGTDV